MNQTETLWRDLGSEETPQIGDRALNINGSGRWYVLNTNDIESQARDPNHWKNGDAEWIFQRPVLSFTWISLEERKPTKQDADEEGRICGRNEGGYATGAIHFEQLIRERWPHSLQTTDDRRDYVCWVGEPTMERIKQALSAPCSPSEPGYILQHACTVCGSMCHGPSEPDATNEQWLVGPSSTRCNYWIHCGNDLVMDLLGEFDAIRIADAHNAALRRRSASSDLEMNYEDVARLFHDTYERLAPSFGYETRTDTKQFDPTTPNGELMITVCEQVAAVIMASRDREMEELKEWKNSVLEQIKCIPEYSSGQWGGDKEGWGFCFELIGWQTRELTALHHRLATAEADAKRFREELQNIANANLKEWHEGYNTPIS